MKKIKTAIKLSALTIVAAFTLAAGPAPAQQSPIINNTTNTSLETKPPMPVGNAPATFNSPGGKCGEGFSISVGGPYAGVGGGKTKQNETCLKQEAATDMLRAGLGGKDPDITASAVGALRQIHPEIDTSVGNVTTNLMKPCGAEAKRISVLLLTEKIHCTADNKPYLIPPPPAP